MTGGRVAASLALACMAFLLPLTQFACSGDVPPIRLGGTTWPPFTLRGIGVGNPGLDRLSDRDFEKFNTWGVNVLRVYLHGPEEGSLENVVTLAKKYNIRLVFALMDLPGVYSGEGSDEFWSSLKLQQQVVDFWRGIAGRFKNEGDIVAAYDLLNEPSPTGNDRGDNYPVNTPAAPNSSRDLGYLYSRTIAAIRAIDSNRTIIVESRCSGQLCWKQSMPVIGNYAYELSIPVLADPNVVYSIHYYDPLGYTHQGVNGRPVGVEYPGEAEFYGYFDAQRIREELKKVKEFAVTNNVKIFIGEFSVAAWAPNAAQYLRDVTAAFEEYGFNSSYHHYNEYEGWNLELGDTTRLSVMRQYWSLNASAGK